MATAAPAHFFGRETIDFLAGGDGGLRIGIAGELTIRNQRLRRQRCGLCRRRERCGTCRKSKGEFQKVPAFHAISSSALGWVQKKSFDA